MAIAQSSLPGVFGGHEPTFVVDRPETAERLSARGLPAITVALAREAPPENVVLMVEESGPEAHRQFLRMEELFRGARVLVVPIGAFDSSPRATDYTVDLLLRSDFRRPAERARRWREVLARRPSPLEFASTRWPDCRLRCHLLGDLMVEAVEEWTIRPGELRPVGGCFEVEMEFFDRAAHYFSVDGQFPVTGMLTAKHATLPADLVPLHSEAVDMVRRYAAHTSGGVLHIRDNRVESFSVDGEEWAPTLFRLTGEAHDFNVIEFAIGTNSPADVDWSVNSCLNEGVQGIHVAVGDGVTGAHIDFIASDMQLVL